jgi:hypothetical protein
MAKRILRRFRLDEVSAVDKPAQAGARVLIMKRHDEGIEKMSRAGGDTMDADEEFLSDVADVFVDSELSEAERKILLINTVTQYLVAQGKDFSEMKPGRGAPKGGLASPDIVVTAVTKLIDDLRTANPSLSEIKARAKLFEDPANRDLVKGYNEAMAELEDEAIEKASRVRRRPETPEQRRNRLKQERSQAPSKSSPMVRKAVEGETFNSEAAQALRRRAAEFMKADPMLTRSRALDRIASSRDPSDREVWLAARRDSAD